jgi:Protein of unknown function (DUF2924)
MPVRTLGGDAERDARRLFEHLANPAAEHLVGVGRPLALMQHLEPVETRAEVPRQVKAGSVIIREHQGVVHEVLVVQGGFCWQGKTYDSLSTIAKTITGTSWNGPRFFGLRSKKMHDQEAGATNGRTSVDRDPKPQPSASGRRSSVRAVCGDAGARP